MEKPTKKPKDNDLGLKLYYQPIIETMFNKTVGYEALIRLVDKELHFISPGVFIPIAEKSGLNVALGNWIIEETCRTVAKMEKKGIEFEYISLNVSVKHLKKKDYVTDLIKILDENDTHPSKICLEIPEDAFSTDAGSEAVVEKMYVCKNHGFKLAIDDYAGFYLPLSKLDTIPTDIIKLDKAMTDKILIDPKTCDSVESAVKQSVKLGIDVIAKAVEDTKQQKLLESMGCKKMQGYLFGKPVKDRAILYPKTIKAE